MTSRAHSTAVLLIALLWHSPVLSAQQAKTPSLHEILERLDSNLNQYDTGIPSFFCKEHIVSSQATRVEHDRITTIDSIFRLKRTPAARHASTLVETREIQCVDGKPATSQHLDGPTMLNGAFEGGLAVVSLSQAACMQYQLQRIDPSRPSDPYIVRFATVLTPRNTADCLLQENSRGLALIDPTSMQITHLEIATPKHAIIPATPFKSATIGRRDLTVDYDAVVLGGAAFWLPATITMRVTSGAGTFHEMTWSFRATYSNYRKMEVTSRILPGSQKNVP